jgi:hypothetical protein
MYRIFIRPRQTYPADEYINYNSTAVLKYESSYYIGVGPVVLTGCTGRFGLEPIFLVFMLDIKMHLRSMHKPMREEKRSEKYRKSYFPPF